MSEKETISEETVNEEVSNEKEENSSQEEATQDNNAEESNEFEAKYNEVNDKFLRLFSEFDNFRKRTLKEKSELSKVASADLMKNLLPVVDDFERAIKAFDENDEGQALKEGVQLIYQKLMNTLKQKGLEPMDAMGKPFDADLYEAITNIPAPEEDQKGLVLDVLEKGYTLNGTIIRYAKVVVGA